MASWDPRFGDPPGGEADWSALGLPCTKDCSGHSRGFAWGARFGIHDAEYSAGNSNSFNEGVRAYAAQWLAANAEAGAAEGEQSYGGRGSRAAAPGTWGAWVRGRGQY